MLTRKYTKTGYGCYDVDPQVLIDYYVGRGYKLKDAPVAPVERAQAATPAEQSATMMSLLRENERLAERCRVLEDRREMWRDVMQTLVRPIPQPEVLRDSKAGKFPYIAIHQFSDWHDEPERLIAYREKVDDILSDVSGELVGHVLSFGGDEVHGTVHFPGQQFSYQRNCGEQMVRAGTAKVQLCEWAKGYGVPVTCLQVEGNHATTGEQWGGLGHHHDNWDYASGLFAQSHTGDWCDWVFTDDDDQAYAVKFNIGGYTILSCHGNHIKSHSRTPFYGLETAARNILEQLQGAERLSPRLLLIHHFHRFAQFEIGGTHVSMNGALQGFTTYAAKRGYPPSERSQTCIILKADKKPLIWGVHKIVCE